jgi:hypothetical protein
MCSWLYTVSTSALAECVGELSSVKLAQLNDMLRIAELDWIGELPHENS